MDYCFDLLYKKKLARHYESRSRCNFLIPFSFILPDYTLQKKYILLRFEVRFFSGT